MADHPQKYSETERYNMMRHCIDLMLVNADVLANGKSGGSGSDSNAIFSVHIHHN